MINYTKQKFHLVGSERARSPNGEYGGGSYCP